MSKTIHSKSVPCSGSHHQHGEVHEERAQPAGHRDGEDQGAQHTQSIKPQKMINKNK